MGVNIGCGTSGPSFRACRVFVKESEGKFQSFFSSSLHQVALFDMADIQVESKPLLVPPELTVRVLSSALTQTETFGMFDSIIFACAD